MSTALYLPSQSEALVVEMQGGENKLACQLDLGSKVKRETGLQDSDKPGRATLNSIIGMVMSK